MITRMRQDIDLTYTCEAEDKRRHTVAEPPASAPCLNMPLNEEEIEENIDFCAAPVPAPAPTCPTEEALSTGRSAPDDVLERDMRRMACARGMCVCFPRVAGFRVHQASSASAKGRQPERRNGQTSKSGSPKVPDITDI